MSGRLGKAAALLGLILVGCAEPAYAQITYVATSVSVLSSNTVSSLTMTEPTGMAVGDVMVALITENAFPTSGLSGAVPSGWTLVTYDISGSLGEAVIYKVAAAADVGTTPPSATFTFTAAGRAAGTILAFRGVSTASPVVTSGNQLNASGATRTAPSVTPGTPSTMLLALYTVANGTTDTLSNPSGMTQDVDVSTQFGSSGLLIGAFYKLLSASTATGTLVTNSSGAISAVSIGTTLALLPAVGTPAALWHLDDSSWSGTAGEVVDSSGNGYGGTAEHGATTTSLSPAITGTMGTCGYGSFNGTSQYLQMPGNLPHAGSTFTVTAWIRPTAGTQGRIWSDDEQLNGYALSFADPGSTKVRFYSRAPTLVNDDSIVALTLNQWYFVAAVMDAVSAHTMTLYIYNSSGTLLDTETVARTAFSAGSGANATIGGDADAAVEGAIYRFPGNIDEVTLYSNALTAAQVKAAATLIHPCPSTVYAASFHITTSNYGIYCLPQTVTVAVRDASGNPFSSFAGTISLSASTGKGTWSLTSGGGTFTDAVPNDGLATYTFPGNQPSAIFALSYSSGAPTVTVDAAQSSPTVIKDDGAQGAIVFAPSGFTVTSSPFTSPAGGVAAFSSPQIAGTAFNVYITAYGVNPTDNTCGVITTYAGAKSINFWSTYVNPATGTVKATVNGTAAATVETSSAAQAITFTSGQTVVTASYKDAGSLGLSMKDATTGANPNLPAGIRGSTGTVVSRPANFVVSNIKNTGSGAANPAASTASGLVFVAAGQAFTATVTAVESGGTATPNFGRESPAESVRFGTSLVLPAGGDAPSVTGTFPTFASGAATGTAFAWPEVGIVTLIPRVSDGDYLGSGDVVGTATGNVGRFIPYSFAVVLNTPVFASGCTAGGFSYVGQSLLYTVAPMITATAQALGGTTALNYRAALFRLTNTSLTGRSYTPTPASPALTLSGLPATSVDPAIVDLGTGQATMTFSAGAGILFTRGGAIAPFNANIALSINVIDLDGAAASNPVSFGAGTGIVFSTGPTQLYGRLVLRNVLGSELLDLPMPLTTEYYLGTTQGFTTNLTDTCTATPSIAFSAYQQHLSAGQTCVRDSGTPGLSGAGCAASAGGSIAIRANAAAGGFNLHLSAPGDGNYGAVTVTAGAPTWLQYLWNPTSGSNSSPFAMATFGVFPAPATRVYQREVY
jgi:MSHA biogenesis protein MshQ